MLKHARWVFAVCLPALVLSAPLAFGAKGQSQGWDAIKAEKVAQGWVEVAPRVLERRLGSRVEHVGYGQQGLAWLANELQQRLDFLKAENEAYPSPDVAKIIDALTTQIDKARSDVRKAADAPVPDCSITYGASADGYPLTTTQGVAGVASAQFTNNCGFGGDTYAYAFARATAGTTTTTNSTQDPKSGTSISSYAFASANGGSVAGIPCYSEGYAYAQSSALGISYSQYDPNSLCPQTPLSVTISGTTYESFINFNCRSRTWTSSVSGGTGIYGYQWLRDGSLVSNGSSYTGYVCGYDSSFTLTLNVNDSAGATASDTHAVFVDYYDPDPGCNPICP